MLYEAGISLAPARRFSEVHAALANEDRRAKEAATTANGVKYMASFDRFLLFLMSAEDNIQLQCSAWNAENDNSRAAIILIP